MDSVCESDVASIVSVRDELTVGKDELADWAKKRKDAAWFLAIDDGGTQENFAEIVQHVATTHYNAPAVEKFLGSADSLLIAKARAIGATVITHELPNPESKKRVLIPDVCNVFDVLYMNTFEALRQFSAKFVWSA